MTSAQVRIQPSQSKNKLFVGGIPHDLTREALEQQLLPLVKGEPAQAAWADLAACCLLLLLHVLVMSTSPSEAFQPPLSPAFAPLSTLRRNVNARSSQVPGSHPAPARLASPWAPLIHPAPPSLPLGRPPPRLPALSRPPGLEKIDMSRSRDPAHPEHNRGFAFLEFYNSACAAAAKHALSQPDFK